MFRRNIKIRCRTRGRRDLSNSISRTRSQRRRLVFDWIVVGSPCNDREWVINELNSGYVMPNVDQDSALASPVCL